MVVRFVRKPLKVNVFRYVDSSDIPELETFLKDINYEIYQRGILVNYITLVSKDGVYIDIPGGNYIIKGDDLFEVLNDKDFYARYELDRS